MLGAESACAVYMKPQLEQVPVAKLVENLEKALKDKPNSVKLRYNLARVHAMAYALKTDKAQVNKLVSPTTLWFDSEPPKLRQPHLGPNEGIMPFAPKAATDKAALKAAMEHLDKAIKRYEETVLMAPDNLAARLGLAWVTEQSGNKEKAIAQYRDVIRNLSGCAAGFCAIQGDSLAIGNRLVAPQQPRAKRSVICRVSLRNRATTCRRLGVTVPARTVPAWSHLATSAA
jgi:tetratricopeptide (TPR) repeat protein